MAKYFIIGEEGQGKLWLVNVEKGTVTELSDADLKAANNSGLNSNRRKRAKAWHCDEQGHKHLYCHKYSTRTWIEIFYNRSVTIEQNRCRKIIKYNEN